MARDDNDDFEGDERVTRTTRRPAGSTERLPTREIPQDQPVRSDWLSSRTAGRTTKRRAGTVPSSRQEFILWLQYGGWRTVAIVAAATFAALMLMAVFANRANLSTAGNGQPTPEIGVGGNVGAALIPTLDPLAQPSVTPAPSAVGADASGAAAQFRVSGTDGIGLFLRSDHVSEPSNILETLPDGTVVTIAGEDFVGADRVWKKIRAPSGKEGWAATDFLQQVQP